MPNQSNQLRSLIEVVNLLALPAEAQVSALPSFVDVADELATLFGDQLDAVSNEELELELGAAASAMIGQIGAALNNMGGKEEYFSTKALENREEWARIRRLSQAALAAANLAPHAPDLSWVSYQRG